MEIYYEEEKQNQKKSKTPIFIGIFIILLIILTIIVVYAIMYIKTKVLKVKQLMEKKKCIFLLEK